MPLSEFIAAPKGSSMGKLRRGVYGAVKRSAMLYLAAIHDYHRTSIWTSSLYSSLSRAIIRAADGRHRFTRRSCRISKIRSHNSSSIVRGAPGRSFKTDTLPQYLLTVAGDVSASSGTTSTVRLMSGKPSRRQTVAAWANRATRTRSSCESRKFTSSDKG